MCRFDDKQHRALVEYAKQTGIDVLATAVRQVVVEKLRAVGLLNGGDE